MLEAPSRETLPTHSTEVCPWGKTCPVHGRRQGAKATHACPFSCSYSTPKAGLLQDHLARTHHLPWWKRQAAMKGTAA